jgi:superfamily II DNA or RNA helicase
MDIIVNNIDSVIQTDNQELLQSLVSLYSFKVPGAEYTPAYKRRGWDGKKSFISRAGVFKTGLLEDILKDLRAIECIPNIILDSGTEEPPSVSLIDGFTYYDFQEILIKKALDLHRGVIKSPTGSGKTLIMAGLVKSLIGKKMIILFNAKQLLTQTYEFLTNDCKIKNVGLCFGEGYIYGDIMLCTVQSIEKILDTHLKEAEVLMVDECHEFANGKTTLAAINSFPKAKWRFGFTATPPPENIPKHSLRGALGPTIQEVTTSALVEDEKLAKPIIQLINRSYSASGADENMTYLEIYDEFIVNNESRNNQIKEIVNDIRKNTGRSRILILTKSLAHGRALEKLLGDGQVQFLEGADGLGDRYKSISKFRRSRGSSTLIGTKILQTGINIEEITHFINARGMKSEIATIQALGRALRAHETKPIVYIYDFLDKEKYLKNHARSRRRHYEKEGHEVRIL